MKLAERLCLFSEDRNALLLSAGFAPLIYKQLLNGSESGAYKSQIAEVLAAQMPNPCLALDRRWNLIEANQIVHCILEDLDVDAQLLIPPVNLIRLILHPKGLAPSLEDLPLWHQLLMNRLRNRQARINDPILSKLYNELDRYTKFRTKRVISQPSRIALPFRLRLNAGTTSFLSTMMVFEASSIEGALPEIVVETFLSIDDQTTAILKKLVERT